MEESHVLKKNPTGMLASRKACVSVGALEKVLLAAFPKEDACSWDYTGMFVGNPAEEVRGVAVALDPTVRAMKEAVSVGRMCLFAIILFFSILPHVLLRRLFKGKQVEQVFIMLLVMVLAVCRFIRHVMFPSKDFVVYLLCCA